MASTSQHLTWIALECHGWQPEGGQKGILPLYNQAHRILNTSERDQNLLYDSSTGDFPYITTQSNVFQYSCPTNVWMIKHIVVDFETILENDATSQRSWKTEEVQIGGISYRRVLNVKSSLARTTGSGNVVPAIFTFIGLNPGSTTSTFRRVAYKLPVEITSQRIQHECPSPEAEQILMQATMSLIDAINDHKKQLAVTKYIEEYLKPRYYMELDKGEQATPDFCVKRPF
jgi:hypothetical protein